MSEKSSKSLPTLIVIIWFNVLAILQFFSIYQLFTTHYQWGWFLAGLASLFLFYIPIIGSIAAYFGATLVWGWIWWKAGLVFFSCAIAYVIIMAFALLIDISSRKT